MGVVNSVDTVGKKELNAQEREAQLRKDLENDEQKEHEDCYSLGKNGEIVINYVDHFLQLQEKFTSQDLLIQLTYTKNTMKEELDQLVKK